MKPVNKKAKRIMEGLIAELGSKQHEKFAASKGFMDLVVERIGSVQAGTLYSFAHYYTQNGDAMRDPEMTFLHVDSDEHLSAIGYGNFYPLSFLQDGGFPLDQQSVVFDDMGEMIRYSPRMQRDQATFAGQWMVNAKDQRAPLEVSHAAH